MRNLQQLLNVKKNGYVSLYPELDIANQGDSVENARHNLVEALELFFEYAPQNRNSGKILSIR